MWVLQLSSIQARHWFASTFDFFPFPVFLRLKKRHCWHPPSQGFPSICALDSILLTLQVKFINHLHFLDQHVFLLIDSSFSDFLSCSNLPHLFWINLFLSSIKVKVAQLCPTLCDPMDYTVHGILQARILEWVAFPFSMESSQTRDWIQVSHTAGRFFTS